MARDFGTGICPQCGAEFKRKSGIHKYCSEKCQKGSQRAKADKVNEKLLGESEWAECRWCGKWFKRPYKGRVVYCSDRCKYMDMTNGEHKKREKRRPRKKPKVEKKDGFTWDDIRKVLAEYGISSYSKALEILEKRRKEAEREVMEREIKESD